MSEKPRHYTECFEPEAEAAISPEHAALVSIAISLKRIADTMDGTTAGVSVSETIFGGRT